MQLRRLTLQVENVLKGDAPLSVVEVYYFTFASGFDGPQPLGLWLVGGRRIFFLQRENGLLRTACDGWDGCTIGVHSGAHSGYRPEPDRAVEYAIDDILLTRGTGAIDEGHFAASVERGGRAPQDYQIGKFRALALAEHSVVKTSACLALAHNLSRHDLLAYMRNKADILRNADAAKRAMSDAHCDCMRLSDGVLLCSGPTADPISPPLP